MAVLSPPFSIRENKTSRAAIRSRSKPAICEIDVSQSPQMAQFSKTVSKLCEVNYPKIKKILISKSDPFEPPKRIQIVFKNNQADPGQALGSTISLSSDWFTKYPKDLGAIVHEMAHVVQSYPPEQPAKQPFWLREGIADYIRYELGYQNEWSYPHCGPGSEHYTSGYWCSAAFLTYLVKKHDKDLVRKLNRSLRTNVYSETLFQESTGQSLQQLWQQCLQETCAGGKP